MLNITLDGDVLYLTEHALKRFFERGISLGIFNRDEVKGRVAALCREILERSTPGFFVSMNNHGEAFRYDHWLFIKEGGSIVTCYSLNDKNHDTEFFPWNSRVFNP